MNYNFIFLGIIVWSIELTTIADESEREWTSTSGYKITASLSHHDTTNAYLNVGGNIQPISKSVLSSNDIAVLDGIPIGWRSEKIISSSTGKNANIPSKEQLKNILKMMSKLIEEGNAFEEMRNDFGVTKEQVEEAEQQFSKYIDSVYVYLHRINSIVFPDISDFNTKEITDLFLKLKQRISYLEKKKLKIDPKYGFYNSHYGLAMACLTTKYIDRYNLEVKNGQTPDKRFKNLGGFLPGTIGTRPR